MIFMHENHKSSCVFRIEIAKKPARENGAIIECMIHSGI